MNMKISVELAKEKDNKDLLELMARIPMPGFVRVAYRREPNFFDALGVEGKKSQTIVGRDLETGRIIGAGTRSIKTMYVNGKPMDVGYLSGLRVYKEYRGGMHLARGYRAFKNLHNGGGAPFYLCTILDNNIDAKKLTTGRIGLPVHRDIGQFRCMAIALSQSDRKKARGGINIRSAVPEDAAAIIRFLNTEGRRKQFFPVYTEKDLFAQNGLLRGIAPEDVLMAFSGGQLLGVIAAWDQKKFRRSVVVGYPKWLSLSRFLYNFFAKYFGFPVLPAVGSVLSYFYLSLVCICENNREIFSNLLTELMARKRGRYSFMMAGMHEKDSLLAVLENFRHFKYSSRVYLAYWEDGEKICNKLDDSPPYLEVGAL